MSTVLVIDDDPQFLDQMDTLLSTAGYRVIRATDGNDAVRVLEKRHGEIDLSIVDLGLPGINGFEIIGAISRRATKAKIIATTAIYKDMHLEMSETLGAHAAIRKPPAGKPLPEREWLDTVRRLIGSAEHEKSIGVAWGQGIANDSEPTNGTEEEH
jgi:DNA-binding response OmpR family regulator